MPHERRTKIIRISKDLLIHALIASGPVPIIPMRIKMSGIPDDYAVEDVNYDYLSECFIARIYHPSFPIVSLHDNSPEADVQFELANEPHVLMTDVVLLVDKLNTYLPNGKYVIDEGRIRFISAGI